MRNMDVECAQIDTNDTEVGDIEQDAKLEAIKVKRDAESEAKRIMAEANANRLLVEAKEKAK